MSSLIKEKIAFQWVLKSMASLHSNINKFMIIKTMCGFCEKEGIRSD